MRKLVTEGQIFAPNGYLNLLSNGQKKMESFVIYPQFNLIM